MQRCACVGVSVCAWVHVCVPAHACVCPCLCALAPACMRACMRTCMHAYVHASVRAYVCIWVRACVRVSMRTWVRACVRVSMRACVCAREHACVRACMRAPPLTASSALHANRFDSLGMSVIPVSAACCLLALNSFSSLARDAAILAAPHSQAGARLPPSLPPPTGLVELQTARG